MHKKETLFDSLHTIFCSSKHCTGTFKTCSIRLNCTVPIPWQKREKGTKIFDQADDI